MVGSLKINLDEQEELHESIMKRLHGDNVFQYPTLTKNILQERITPSKIQYLSPNMKMSFKVKDNNALEKIRGKS